MFSIYTIRNLCNDKVYVGKSNNPTKRWQEHIASSKRDNAKSKLYRAMTKYSIDNFKFDIIYQSKDEEYILNVMEPYFIKEYNSFSNGYNETLGGAGVMTGRKMSQSHKDKISAAQRGRNLSEKHKKALCVKKKSNLGEDHHNTKIRKTYKITFSDQTTKIVVGLNKFAKDNGYNKGCLSSINLGASKTHKDIIGVEQIDS